MDAAKSLQGKVAIVTGGSRGIGRGIATELGRLGANVLITYSSAEAQANDVCTSIKKYGVESIACKAVGTDRAAPQAIVDLAVKEWGVIDIIVNNAAAGGELSLAETTNDDFDAQVSVNLRFPLFLIKHATPHFGKAPRIVNMSSIYARSGHSNCLVYTACKGALEAATRSLARELGQSHNATVNCVNPGPVNTDLWAKAVEDPSGSAKCRRRRLLLALPNRTTSLRLLPSCAKSEADGPREAL